VIYKPCKLIPLSLLSKGRPTAEERRGLDVWLVSWELLGVAPHAPLWPWASHFTSLPQFPHL